ncbi:MAG: tetratricopeptide repeat protein [Candidatus Latescibacteria bacterium]|nr:tetratricopeptide repeat protein [Candidatus Latescibacterota bacterium]
MKKYNISLLLLICVSILILLQLLSPLQAQESVVVNEVSGTEYREGLELFKKEKYSESIGHFEKAYQADERNINALFAHGLSLSRLEQYKKAVTIYQQVLKKDPKHIKALKMLPATLINTGDTDKALAVYDRGIEVLPENYFFPFGKAVLNLQLKKYKEAVLLLKKAHEKDPSRIEILDRLLFAYREIGNMEDAFKTGLTILEKNKNHARARVAVADYKRLKGKLEEALEYYEIAARNLETKAYAEHYIDFIHQQLEEIEIEKEYEARQNQN